MSRDKETFISLFSTRLTEERKRLGLNQADAGALCGISREVWGKYERGKVIPSSEVLFNFAKSGADVNYVLTGVRSTNLHKNEIKETSASYDSKTLSEESLLDGYRKASIELKSAALRVLKVDNG